MNALHRGEDCVTSGVSPGICKCTMNAFHRGRGLHDYLYYPATWAAIQCLPRKGFHDSGTGACHRSKQVSNTPAVCFLKAS